jgi:DNA-binding MarR family transcriptional regulator
MVRSFHGMEQTWLLFDDYINGYIVSNMSLSTLDPETERAAQIDYLASHLLSRTVLLVQLLVKQVRSDEISRSEASVLNILSDGPRRITELAELAGLAQPTMTLLIKRLEERGYVTRKRLPEDGRVVMITIARRGRSVLKAFRARVLAALRTDLAGLSDHELAALCAATDTLGSFLDELQAGPGK